jgi:hypothetical protein
MIVKDFHRISGKSFVIMGRAEATAACPKCAVLLARPTGAKCAFGLALAGPNAHLAGVPSAGDWRLAIGGFIAKYEASAGSCDVPRAGKH